MNYDKLQAATAIRRTTTTKTTTGSPQWRHVVSVLDGGKGLGRKPVKGAKNCTKINKEKNARGVSNKILDKYTEKKTGASIDEQRVCCRQKKRIY